jgi:hypothetical protein
MKISFILLSIILLVSIIILSILKNIPEYTQLSQNYIKNPPQYYWLNRSDGSGQHSYFTDGNYLTLTINPLYTGSCSQKSDCKGLNVDCVSNQCIPYSNAEIYNNTCCSTIDSLPSDGNILTDFRKSLLKTICEDQQIIQNCSLEFNPVLTLDDPINQTRQAIKDTVLNTPYLYNTVTTYVQCKGLNAGSRGWGFWNTLPSLNNTAIAWFIQMDGGKDYPLNGFYIQCQSPGDPKNISFTKIKDLDEELHRYDIIWTNNSIKFLVDNVLVYTETKFIPNIGMAYHNWVDNSVFSYENNMLVHLLQDLKEEKSNIITSLEISKS